MQGGGLCRGWTVLAGAGAGPAWPLSPAPASLWRLCGEWEGLTLHFPLENQPRFECWLSFYKIANVPGFLSSCK